MASASSDSDTDNDAKSFVSKSSVTFHPCPHEDCDKYFSRPSRLQTHLLSHTGERPFKCEAEGCDKSFTRPAHLKRHFQNSHQEKKKAPSVSKSKCPQCPKEFANKYSLQKHVKIHHQKDRYECDQCGQTFHKHNFLTVHISTEHEKMEHPHECKECGKKFQFPNKLRNHMEQHHKTYPCTKCDQTFEKWTLLRKHRDQEHSKLTCDVCDQTFANKANYRTHQRVHADQRQVFHCPHKMCNRFYYKESNLQDHLKGYHDGKRFPCTVDGCEARLSSRRKLSNHIKAVHHEKKPPKHPKTGPERAARSDKGLAKRSMVALLTGADIDKQKDQQLLNGEVGRLDPVELAKEVEENPDLNATVSESEEEPVIKKVRAEESFGEANGFPVFELREKKAQRVNIHYLSGMFDRQMQQNNLKDMPEEPSSCDELFEDEPVVKKPDSIPKKKYNFLKYVKNDE